MLYATKQDMIDRYGAARLIQLTDINSDEPTEEINDTVLLAALSDATALIGSFVKRRYKTTFDTVPAVLRKACTTIAFYELHSGRYTDEVRKAYEDAINYLEKISSGAAQLDIEGVEPPSASAEIFTDDTPRTFSRKDKWF